MTNRCEQMRAQMVFYLDDELQPAERAELEAHLQSCTECRELCAREAALLASVRDAQPLHETPPALRARISELLNAPPEPAAASQHLRRRVQNILWPEARTLFRSPLLRLAGLATVLLAIVLAGYWLWRRAGDAPLRPSELAIMAVDTHLRHLRGQLPLEIVSTSPKEISAWFAGKLPFSLKLPNYQEESGQEKLYHLQGARLVGFKNDYAAFIAYQMRRRPITLVVTANSVALPAGGEEITSKGLKFHYDSINGLKVITWSDRGLTYALVSDLEERGQQSCLVCHAGTKDRDFIEGLKLSGAAR